MTKIARKQGEHAPRSSEAKLARILAIAGDAIVSMDAQHRITLFNEAAERMFGYSSAEALGQPIDILIPTRFQAAHRQHVELFALGPEVARRMGERQEVTGRRRSGEEFPIEASISKLHVDGELVYTTVLRDITRRKKAEEALREQLLAVQRLQTLGSRFVHEGDGNLKEILGEIVDVAIAISSADMGNMQLLDQTTGDLQIVAQRGFAQWWLDYWDSVSRGQGACGTALERGERVIIEDVEKSPIFVGTPALGIQLRAGVRAVQSTPLVGRSGHMLGMFSTHYRTPLRPDERALRALDLLARQAADLIERERAEERRQLLIRELDHRVKNVLARVAAVATHTGRVSSTKEELLNSLGDRIQSLADAHVLLSRSRWQGVGLADLVRHQLAPYTNVGNTTIDGPKVRLTSAATEAVVMVLCELVTNAAKYGALSMPQGRVSVTWAAGSSGRLSEGIVIRWQETGGPLVTPPKRSGYGTNLIRRLIPHEIDGAVDLLFKAEGVNCTITLPAEQLVARDR